MLPAIDSILRLVNCLKSQNTFLNKTSEEMMLNDTRTQCNPAGNIRLNLINSSWTLI
jgi:hypothetical protein